MIFHKQFTVVYGSAVQTTPAIQYATRLRSHSRNFRRKLCLPFEWDPVCPYLYTFGPHLKSAKFTETAMVNKVSSSHMASQISPKV